MQFSFQTMHNTRIALQKVVIFTIWICWTLARYNPIFPSNRSNVHSIELFPLNTLSRIVSFSSTVVLTGRFFPSYHTDLFKSIANFYCVFHTKKRSVSKIVWSSLKRLWSDFSKQRRIEIYLKVHRVFGNHVNKIIVNLIV